MRFCSRPTRPTSTGVAGLTGRPNLAYIDWKAWSHKVTTSGTSASVMARRVTMGRYCQTLSFAEVGPVDVGPVGAAGFRSTRAHYHATTHPSWFVAHANQAE